ncbi:MAG: hypothetical protein AAF757_24540, partial [Cyanobacteria bacterium P01_D01_bin.116]
NTGFGHLKNCCDNELDIFQPENLQYWFRTPEKNCCDNELDIFQPENLQYWFRTPEKNCCDRAKSKIFNN